MSITAAISTHARRQGGKTALICGNDTATWIELDNNLHRLASHLLRLTHEPAIVLHLPNSPALVTLFLATARSGKEALLFDPDWPSGILNTLLRKIPHALLITYDPQLARERNGIMLDPEIAFQAVPQALGAAAEFGEIQEPDSSQPFYVGFTSGSTGLPKGYRRNHLSWLAGYPGEEAEFGLNVDDVVVVPGPMAHSLSPYAIVRGLNAGAKVHFFRQFSPRAIWRTVCSEATVLYCVPTQLSILLSIASRETQTHSSRVRLIMSTGAKSPVGEKERVQRFFRDVEFVEFYGTSELGYLTIAKSSEKAPTSSVGRPFPGVTITIRDNEGKCLNVDQSGLVYVESSLMFMSYAFGSDGLERRIGNSYTAGDVGYFDQGGFLHLVGRADRMIISGGRNIYPEEIERVLEFHPSIEKAAVVGIADSLRGQRIVACLDFRPGGRPSRAELMRFVKDQLADHKIPRIYVTVTNWPSNNAGKLSFAVLKQMIESQDFVPID